MTPQILLLTVSVIIVAMTAVIISVQGALLRASQPPMRLRARRTR